MSVFSTFYRYRFSFLFLLLWLIAVLLLSDRPATSQLITASKWVNNHQQTVVLKHAKPIKVTENVNKTVLENGLTVLTKEVHTAPVVTVQVWYKIGARNEEPGVNGIAHQLEHMMFKGTTNRPIQFGRLFSALGSDSNAFTSYDQTAYYGTAERDKLKALLLLEADRMENSVIDAKKLASEKRVVISELQGYENSPNYRLSRAVLRAAFPDSAYGLPVGGTKADVEKFQVEQVQAYYQKFYNPNNAVLVIVGDFDTAKTTETVKEAFGKIPKNQERGVRKQELGVRSEELGVRKKSTAQLNTPIVLKEPGAGALLQAVYPLPSVNHPDVPALNVMDYILTEGRNSRLHQTLVESGVATDVSAAVVSLVESGWYEVEVTADESQNLKKIDSVLNSAIANLTEKGVTPEELNRAKAQLEANVILDNRDITNQAMQLGNDQTTAGDYRYTDRYLAAISQVTAQDVQRVANKYLNKEARTVGFFEPTQMQPNPKRGGKANSAPTTENFSGEESKLPSEVGKYLPPVDSTTSPIGQILPQELKLDNGLRVLLLPDNSTPTVTLSGYMKAGTEFEPGNKAGLASLVAENLMNGTPSKDFLTIAKALEERGADLDFETYREGVLIHGDTLATDLPVLMQTLADVVKNPTFPTKELEISRQQTLTDLKQELDDPSEVARRTFVQSVYPKQHPLHTYPTVSSVRLISRQDVIDFHSRHYRPDTTVLALVGDFDFEVVRDLVQSQFGDWQLNGTAPTVKYPKVPMPDKVVRVNPVVPGKAEAITYMGNTAINRKDPRFYAALVLNQILGGDTLSSRLGAELRDRLGLTYGIYSSFQTGLNAGTFLIEMQTSPEDAPKAIASTRHLLKQIHTQGVSFDELQTAKRTLVSNYNVSLANPEELTYRMLMNQVYGLQQEELRDFSTKIQKVTLAEVNQAARELVHPDRIVVVTAGPAANADQAAR